MSNLCSVSCYPFVYAHSLGRHVHYLWVQRKEAIAYGTYACTNTFLPTAVAAIVLFYGGNLVLQGHMSAGALVSFMLYQQSLASAFQVSFLCCLYAALFNALDALDALKTNAILKWDSI